MENEYNVRNVEVVVHDDKLPFSFKTKSFHFLPEGYYTNPNNIKKVIFNPPATIVIWNNDEKEIVKTNGERFDKEKGLMMAIARKMFGSRNEFKRFLDKWE